MPRIAPLPESEATDRVEQTYGRIRDLLGTDSVPEMILPMGRVEPFLRDFYMNFKKFVWSDGAIDPKTKAAVALVVSCHSGEERWIGFYTDRCVELGWSEQQVAEIIAVAATNYMYNTFFKFRDISGSDLFDGMSVGLRAHTFAGTSLEESLVELLNIAVSDINVCRPCTSGHVQAARTLHLSNEQLLETIQCASTVYAGCQFTKSAGL